MFFLHEKNIMMRTEHVKRNIDIDKAVRKTSLANSFFYVRSFPLVELLFRFVDKKEYQKKGDASQ